MNIILKTIIPAAMAAVVAWTIWREDADHGELTSEDRIFVCRAVVASLMGRDIGTISALDSSQDINITSTSYVRPSDGSVWKNACRFDSNRVIWASIREDGSIGRWRTDPLDGVVTFSLKGDFVAVSESFPDGSVTRRSFAR